MLLIYLSILSTFGFKVLITNFTTMALCPNTGAEIDLLKKGLSDLGYFLNTNYTIYCVSDFQSILNATYTEAAVGFGGIRIQQNLMNEGYYFTHPTFYSGLNILIKNIEVNSPDHIFDVFQYSV